MTDESQWCRETIDLVANGGIWVVPRSALTFRKTGEDVLTLERRGRRPMGMAGEYGKGERESWAAYQEDDFQTIKLHVEGAGINVLDLTDGLIDEAD